MILITLVFYSIPHVAPLFIYYYYFSFSVLLGRKWASDDIKQAEQKYHWPGLTKV